MMKQNVMNGRILGVNDPIGIGVGRTKAQMEPVLKPTLEDLTVTQESTPEICTLKWDACEGADRYRVDVYAIRDCGPSMGCLGYTSVSSTWVDEPRIDISGLKPAHTYQGIVFAYHGDECIGRYAPVYCLVKSVPVSDILCDTVDDYTAIQLKNLDGAPVAFAPLPAEKSVLLNNNPDRGFRSEELYRFPPEEELPDWTEEGLVEEVRERLAKSIENVTVSRVYMVLTNYTDVPVLPEKLLRYMEAIWGAYRTLGVKMYLNHYYQQGAQTETVSQDVVLRHVKQLEPLFKRNADVFFALNFSFIGSYGEWARIRKPINRQLFVNTFLDAVPEQTRLIIRQPMNKKLFINKDYCRYYRIGFADDACHGLMLPHTDMGQGYAAPGSEWWDMIVRESPYTVNDSELFSTRWIRLSGTWPTGYSCMQSLSQKHISILSIQHGYADIYRFGGVLEETCMYGWKAEEVTPQLLDEFGLAYTENWFINAQGERVKRSAFEYLRDHLGYRVSLKSASAKREGDSLKIGLKLKNYGYTSAFNLTATMVLLNGDGEEIASVPAGDPEEWYGTNPADYNDRVLLCHNVEATLPLPAAPGKYRVALVLKNDLARTARLDNTVEYRDGRNILFDFAI